MSKKKAPFTNAQRITLIARTAWAKLSGAGAIDESFNDWRQREAVDTCGARISAATKSQLDRLETHFLAMGGNAAEAYQSAIGPSNELRQLCHLITIKAHECGVTAAYVQAISRRQSGSDEPLTVSAARALLIALKHHARSAAKTGKEAA
jgi:hypothetical protein